MSQEATYLALNEKAERVEPLAEWSSPATGKHLRIDGGTEFRPEPRTSAELLTRGDTFEQFVAKYGQCYDSYQATEPGRLSFWSRTGPGLISYLRRGRYVLVGGGLIAPEAHKETLLREFAEQSKRDNLRAAFFNISEEDVPLFRKCGYKAVRWGQEPVLDLRSLTWSGKSYEWVRRQSNYCLRHGVVATEVRQKDVGPEVWERTLAEVREVARESLSQKAQPEGMRFMEGCIDTHELGLRRLFIARSGGGQGRIEGFVICNPLRNGTMWSTELYRHRLDSVRGTIAFLFHHLMEQMRVEGVERVHLCLDPGKDINNPLPGDSWIIRLWWRTFERFLGTLFDFAGVRHFRSRYRPQYENRYLCAHPGSAVPLLWTFVNAIGCFRISYSNVFRICLDRIRKRTIRKTLSGND